MMFGEQSSAVNVNVSRHVRCGPSLRCLVLSLRLDGSLAMSSSLNYTPIVYDVLLETMSCHSASCVNPSVLCSSWIVSYVLDINLFLPLFHHFINLILLENSVVFRRLQ